MTITLATKGLVDVGAMFGRLTVVEQGARRERHRMWHCQCACGRAVTAYETNLKTGNTSECRACGLEKTAAARRRHGLSDCPEFAVYNSMIARCSRQVRNNRHFARGIKVCGRWLNGEGYLSGFECFMQDMGLRPSDAHSIEREDNDGHYEPSNCIWATRGEQARNTTRNVWVEFNGRRLIAADAIAEAGINGSCFYERLQRGWSVERALSTPSRSAQ